MTKENSSAVSGSITLFDEVNDLEFYGFAGTFEGVIGFIEATLLRDWSVNPPRPLLLKMLEDLERKASEITGQPGSPNHDEKEKVLKNFRRSLANCLESLEVSESTDLEQKLMLNFFEVGVHCGIMSALLEQSFQFLGKDFHSKICASGRSKREGNTAEELSRLVQMIHKMRAVSPTKGFDESLDDVDREKMSDLITKGKLAIASLGSEFRKSLQDGLSLWAAGSVKYHNAMTDDMIEKHFPRMAPPIRGAVRNELMERFKTAAIENGFGGRVRGIRKK